LTSHLSGFQRPRGLAAAHLPRFLLEGENLWPDPEGVMHAPPIVARNNARHFRPFLLGEGGNNIVCDCLQLPGRVQKAMRADEKGRLSERAIGLLQRFSHLLFSHAGYP
jgi:hypothetical protein